MLDPELFGRAMGDEIVKAVAPLRAEIAELKRQLAEKPDYVRLVADEVSKALSAIRQPQDGKDCDMEVVKSLVADAVADLPKAQNGEDGRSVTLAEVQPLLDEAMKAIRAESASAVERMLMDGRAEREAMQKAMSELRQPEDGKSVTLAEVQPLIDIACKSIDDYAAKLADDVKAARETLDSAVKALRQPLDGKSVTLEEVRPILDVAVQSMQESAAEALAAAIKSIPEPQAGKDGVSLAGAMIDREGALMVTLSNGEVKSLGKVVGKDGLDGLSLDAFDMDYLEETHEVRVKASCAGRTKELRYPAGGLRPAGYWREGAKAKACETWVHDGSLWIAAKDTPSKPQTGSDDWIIAARKGRDGESIVKTVNAGPAAPIKLGGAK